MIKWVGVLLVMFLFLFVGCGVENDQLVYKDPNALVEDRVEDLVSRMTIEEKIFQLNQWTAGFNTNVNNIGEAIKDIDPRIGSLIYFGADPVYRNEIQKKAIEESRLGIPILMGFDVIHGFRTVYPISLAQASSWNPDLVKQAASVAAKETRLSGIEWTFSPMIDVARDPRWGRMAEGYGEDPYVNGVFGVATVHGYQGDKLNNSGSIAACLKHYAGYGASEGGRDYRYTEISNQTMWDTYLPPFKACIDAGAATVMSSFNDISGIPATSNRYILTEVLKEKWGHEGFVLSDWNAVKQLIDQGAAKDTKEATRLAINAGVEMCMNDNAYKDHLAELIEEGKVSMNLIDESVARVLKVKFELGLFEKPYTEVLAEEDRYLHPESKQVALELAQQSFVLLKNENSILPVDQSLKIAMVGPMVEEKESLLGAWSYHGKTEDVIGLREGMEKEYGIQNIKVAKGCDFEGDDRSGFSKARRVASKADVIVVCLGEKRYWSGENATRSTIELPKIQEDLVVEMARLNKPVVVLLSNGRALDVVNIEKHADAILEIWQPGIMAGEAVANVLIGKVNPSGKLAVTFPYSSGQIPIYYSLRQSARPWGGQGNYQDIPIEPLYWFGHGLSYTTFEYDKLKLSADTISENETLIASVEVANTGNVSGEETVMWFVSDPYATITRPMKELKYFEKKTIKQGESIQYKFEIEPWKDLSYPNAQGEEILDEGEFFLIVNDQKVKFVLRN